MVLFIPQLYYTNEDFLPASMLIKYKCMGPKHFLLSTVSSDETLSAVEGNPYRDVWKAACWKMSEEVSVHFSPDQDKTISKEKADESHVI